jgi:hypothetical protein
MKTKTTITSFTFFCICALALASTDPFANPKTSSSVPKGCECYVTDGTTKSNGNPTLMVFPMGEKSNLTITGSHLGKCTTKDVQYTFGDFMISVDFGTEQISSKTIERGTQSSKFSCDYIYGNYHIRSDRHVELCTQSCKASYSVTW